jgi:acyl-CoA synthetase (AMP-forming)/AMP-acid ligase II
MLTHRFTAIARQQPGALAVIDGPHRITYQDLSARADRLASYLSLEAGLRPGHFAAVSLHNGWEVIAALLAVTEIGAIWAPFHPQWRSREIAWLAQRLSPRVLITSSALAEAWREAGAPPPRLVLTDSGAWREIMSQPCASLPALEQAPDRPVACFTTSGSTGRPRIALRSAANLLAAAGGTIAPLALEAGMRFLSVVPFYYSGGFDNCLLLPLLCGGTAIVQAAFQPTAVADAAAAGRIQVLMGSPVIYRALLDSAAEPSSFSCVSVAVSFGAPMAGNVARGCAERFGFQVRQLYGATEAGVIAIEPFGRPLQSGVGGRPVGHVQVRILDGAGRPLAPRRVGHVAVSGPGVIAGYMDEPELNAELFGDGLFRTGDLGELDDDGLLLLRGRNKSMINLAGIKVDPNEIEQVLLELTEVRECVVRGVRHDGSDEIIEAIIALRPGCALTRQQVVAHCRARLAEFKIPRRIEWTDSLRVELSGKKPKAWPGPTGP